MFSDYILPGPAVLIINISVKELQLPLGLVFCPYRYLQINPRGVGIITHRREKLPVIAGTVIIIVLVMSCCWDTRFLKI